MTMTDAPKKFAAATLVTLAALVVCGCPDGKSKSAPANTSEAAKEPAGDEPMPPSAEPTAKAEPAGEPPVPEEEKPAEAPAAAEQEKPSAP
ncbi:MAG: hypothetical protein WD063_20955 [Pirellulales bacterium]